MSQLGTSWMLALPSVVELLGHPESGWIFGRWDPANNPPRGPLGPWTVGRWTVGRLPNRVARPRVLFLWVRRLNGAALFPKRVFITKIIFKTI